MKPYFLKRKIIREKKCIFILCAAMLLFVVGCGKREESKIPGGRIINVVAFKSTEESISEKIPLVGNIAANEVVEIKSEIDGVVEQINFEEGQWVKEGDILFQIDQRKLEATLAEAEAKLKLAEENKNRYAKLIETKAISRQEYDQALASYTVNQASVRRMQEELKDAVIQASFDGVMGERLISVGQFLTKGTPLSILINQDPVKAEFQVPERYISRIKEGQTIEMRVVAYPNEVFSGKVYFIAPQIDEETRTVLIKARVPNKEAKLRRGMFANLDLIVRVKEDAIVIPEIAVIMDGDETFVYVIDDEQVAQRHTVQIGMRLAGRVEILSGVDNGEYVVVEGHQKLGPGVKVNIRDDKQEKTSTE